MEKEKKEVRQMLHENMLHIIVHIFIQILFLL